MKKKEKQIILKIQLDEKDMTIAGWETTQKGFDKGVILTDEGFVSIFTYLLNHYLQEIHIEKSHKENLKEMEKHPENYVDIIIPDKLFTSRKYDLGELTEFKCRFCNGYLYILKSSNTYYYCKKCFLRQHKDYLN